MRTAGKLSTNAILSLFVILCLLSPATVSAQESKGGDEAAGAYQQAYNLILDEKWDDAAKSLESFLESYAENPWVDDARFWQCYAESKLGKSLEEAFNCYRAFVTNFPDSKWKDDAETHMIKAADQLVREGKIEYKAFIEARKKNEDKEVALSAIMALQAMGSEQALPALLEMMQNTQDNAAREKSVFLLSRFESPEAREKLIGLAKNDPSSQIREKALFWLAQKDAVSAEDIQAIVGIVNNDSDAKVREQGVFALSQVQGRKGAPGMISLARNHPDPNVRQKALFWLSQGGSVSDEDIQAIVDIVNSDSDTKVREQGVFALSQVQGRKGAPGMISLARNHPDPNVRRLALFWLAQGDAVSAEDIQAIVDIINNDSDVKVREQGVFALSQFRGRKGAPAMTNLARNHQDPGVREKAVFWLSQGGPVSAEDIQTIVDIVFNDSDQKVQRSALLALSQISGEQGVDALITVAREHPEKDFRMQAIRFLQRTGSPRAEEVLLELIKQGTKEE